MRGQARDVVEVDAHRGPAARIDRGLFRPHRMLGVRSDGREVAEFLAVLGPLFPELARDVVIRRKDPIRFGEALVA